MITLHTEPRLHNYTIGNYNIIISDLHPCEFNQTYFRNYIHAHDSFEVCLVQSGTGVFINDGSRYIVKEDCLFLGRPYITHEIILSSDVPLRLHYCNFSITHTGEEQSPTEEDMVIKHFLEYGLPLVYDCQCLNSLVTMFNSYQDYGGFFSFDKLLQILLLEIMITLTPQNQSFLKENNLFRREVSKYITEHITEHITVEMLAAHMKMSPRAIFYFFQENFQMTPVHYVNQLKINSSILYLRMGFSITQVSDFFGFSELSSFSRTFKKYTGMSPRKFLSQKATTLE